MSGGPRALNDLSLPKKIKELMWEQIEADRAKKEAARLEAEAKANPPSLFERLYEQWLGGKEND